MRNSTTNSKLTNVFVLAFWLIAWQLLANFIDKEILLVSPIATLETLFKMAVTKSFWLSIFGSLSKIMLGFILALSVGVILGFLAYKIKFIKILVSPLFVIIKASPIASFIILALFWIRSANISTFISFTIAVPIVYLNILTGLESIDEKILEMEKVFKVSTINAIKYIYIPHLKPFLASTVTVAVGFCFKSAIAAEVIALPKYTLGNMLYSAKVLLETDEVFAITFTIIIISLCLEKLILLLLGGKNDKDN